MFKIRWKIFETNSSSTHALLLYGGKISPKKLDKKTIHADYYDWGEEVINNVERKLSYLYTTALNSMGEEQRDIVDKEFSKYYNCKFVRSVDGYGYPDWSIDHQSANNLFRYAYENDLLEQFFKFIDYIVFSNVEILITNDNGGVMPYTDCVYTDQLTDIFQSYLAIGDIEKAFEQHKES